MFNKENILWISNYQSNNNNNNNNNKDFIVIMS